MKKAGAIISVIAGIFGILAAAVTLFVGGVGAAFKADGANTVVGLGWGGVMFSFSVITLGAMAFDAKSRVIGILLIVCSLFGIVLGGTIVAVFMVLSLIGGILVYISVKKNTSESEPLNET